MSTDPDLLTVVEDLRVVGRSFTHRDFVEKVQGALTYAEDWQLPGMLHGRIVRAQVPSARIVSVDTSAAEALPGVRTVLTAKDVPHNEVVDEASGLALDAVRVPVLASDRIRYQGEPLVAVAADTPAIAAEATELVAIEYEELPGVFDTEAALSPDAPAVHPQGNRLVDWRFERGDVEAALRARGRGRGGDIPHAGRRPRLPRARGRSRVDRGRGADAARRHAGHRARAAGRDDPEAADEQGSRHWHLHGRRLRGEGGYDNRAVPGATGLGHPPPGEDGLVAPGVAARPAEEAPLPYALSNGGKRRRADPGAGRRDRR